MQDSNADLRRALRRIALFALLGLFAIPVFCLWFSGHVEARWGEEMREALSMQVLGDATLSEEERRNADAFVAAASVESVCADERTRQELCAPMSDFWQMHWALRISWWAIALGLAALVLIAVTAGLAFRRPGSELAMFSLGWSGLRALTAADVLLQGILVVWLSFWLTAYFFNAYAVKLILVAAVLAGAAVVVVLRAIFRRVSLDNAVAGVPVAEAAAPALWRRLREFSQRLGTEAPTHVVAGIDCNFFVTETPLQVGNERLEGRSLFVSLPLLGVLAREEADAVLAHELTHFSGGDTRHGAALGPKLVQFEHYTGAMQGTLAIVVLWVLHLFRAAFEFALQRRSREREFAADASAAALTSPQALGRALVKVAAYSSYRSQVESGLFQSAVPLAESLGMQQRLQLGLVQFVHSAEFAQAVAQAGTPHPFDSHPPLHARLAHVGARLAPETWPALLESPPGPTWREDIADVDALEAGQWAFFEQEFARQHEESLAWRYEPADDTERALVLRYFPPMQVPMKKGEPLQVAIEGLRDPRTGAWIEWDRVKAIGYEDGSFGSADTLTVTHPEKGMIGTSKQTKLSLAVDAAHRDALKELVGRYWQRHQAMRAWQAAQAGGEPDGS